MKNHLIFVSSGHPEPAMIAAAYARSIDEGQWEISFGSDTIRPASSTAAEILIGHGLEVPIELPLSPEVFRSERYDVVVTFCEKSVRLCGSFAGLPALFHWPMDDLIHCGDPGSRQCLEEFFGRIEERINGIFRHDSLNVVTNLRSTFGSLIDHLADGVVAHDAERRIFVFNRSAEEITGYHAAEVVGRDCHEVFPGLLCGGHCSFCDSPAVAEKQLRYPSQFLRKDGEIRDLEMSSITIRTPGRKSSGVLVIFRDITEVKSLRRSLQSMRGFHGIVGLHNSMQQVFSIIEDVADEQVPVLIQGESGTGKELIAEALHELSSRKDNPFVPVNCGALPEGILESELFGHVKGAFTGAINDKRGRFELADGGTLFLDEIGEISPAVQVRLLRVLEKKSFIPVGGEKPITADIRIICATNRDLNEMVNKGTFREDLFYRLAVYPINAPPLRERKSDIPILIDHFLDRLSLESGRRSGGLARETMNILQSYRWPGNVRQLANVIHYALIRCQGAVIQPDHLPEEVMRELGHEKKQRLGRPKKLDARTVADAIRRHGGNRAKAARELGVARSTIYRHLDEKQSHNTVL